MECDERLPLTRGQLDIWLSEETGLAGVKWQLGMLARIDGVIEHDVLARAIRHVVSEAEPLRAAFAEADGQVFQTLVDYPDVQLAQHDLTGSSDPVRDAYRVASSIRQEPMALTGPLFKFALLQTRVDGILLFCVLSPHRDRRNRHGPRVPPDCRCLHSNRW